MSISRVSMDEKIEADIPLEAANRKWRQKIWGLLEQNLRVCGGMLPRDLPDKITVDVSALNIGIRSCRDIQLPAG